MTGNASDSPQEPGADAVEEARGTGFRPHDPVFPSLDAAGAPTGEGEEPEEGGEARAYELPGGVVAIASGQSFGLEFDLPEANRLQSLVDTFLRAHVRRLKKGLYLRGGPQHLQVGSLLVSEDPVPHSRLRHAKFQWGITEGRVMQLQRGRFPVSHLSADLARVDQTFAGQYPLSGSELALCVSLFLSALGAVAPTPLGVIGTLKFNTNAVGQVTDLDSLLEEAERLGLEQVVLPDQARVSGLHGSMRYWVATDLPVANFSALEAVSGGVVVPNLVRRALTKDAYSWLSLLTILAAVGSYQLAVALNAGGSPPVSLERVLLYVMAGLLVGSLVFTHRFWRLDR